MTSSGRSPAFDGMYSHLIDEDGGYEDPQRQMQRPDVGQSAHPAPSNSLSSRLRQVKAWPYRLATVCLAVLCGILLIYLIAHSKNTPQGGSDATPEIQKHSQDADVSNLTATIKQLQQEKTQMQKEKDELLKQKNELLKEKNELQAKLNATKTPEVPIICPTDWQLFGKSCYLISRVSRDWSSAQSYCQRNGGHLAIIHTAEEQTFLWNLLPRGHWNSYWFGMTDGETEDEWKWVDGTTVVGFFWEDGEPNNHINEDCGYIVKTRVLSRVAIKSWYDAPCSMDLPFICEKEMDASSASSSATTAASH